MGGSADVAKVSISLSFNGQCEAAFRFYERCLGGKITYLLTWGDSPMAKDAPPEWGAKILHASLSVGDMVFAGADSLQYERPRGFAVLLGLNDAADAERIFNALAEDGSVTVPLQETFWALRYGWVTDRFGIPWTINCGEGQK
jgi:PhnB protein